MNHNSKSSINGQAVPPRNGNENNLFLSEEVQAPFLNSRPCDIDLMKICKMLSSDGTESCKAQGVVLNDEGKPGRCDETFALLKDAYKHYKDLNVEKISHQQVYYKAFETACVTGKTDVVRKLLELSPDYGIDPAQFDSSSLCMASTFGYVEIVDMLLKDSRTDPNTQDNYAIRRASEKGHLGVVKLLLDLDLKRGVDPAANDNYAVRLASTNGHLGIVKLLLDLGPERGVDPAAKENFAIRSASKNGHVEIVKLLLERGVDPAAKENYAIRFACANGHLGVVKLLLDLDPERGVDPAAKDNEALRFAAQSGHFEVLEAFDESEHVNLEEDFLQSLRTAAAEQGHDDFVEKFNDTFDDE
jgi:ankyrin repeat protein